MGEVVLDARNLTHTYRKKGDSLTVFSELSLSVRSQQIVAVQGESGSGKTTLLLACGGMLKPEHGSIIVDNVNLYSASPEQRNRIRSAKIGYVFQTLELVPYLNVLDNLTLHDRSLKTEAIDWLERFEMENRVRHMPDELSHGQRQRVALIRALVHQPLVLIADEPTGNLDSRNSQIVFEVMRHYADSGGCVLVATHDSRVSEHADRIFELDKRTLVESARSKGISVSVDSNT